MQAYRTSSKVAKDGSLSLKGLPFRAGDEVEVIVLRQRSPGGDNPHPLRGQPVRYVDPFESVAEEDWNALREKK